MFSYRNRTDAEIEAFRVKVAEDRAKKYEGKVDKETGRWTSSEAATNAIYMQTAQDSHINVRIR